MVFNILMYSALGDKIYQLCKTEDYELIPIWSSIGRLLASSFWGVFGVILGKISIFVPNTKGIVFSLSQIVVWVYYYHKKKKNPIDSLEGNDMIPNNNQLDCFIMQCKYRNNVLYIFMIKNI